MTTTPDPLEPAIDAATIAIHDQECGESPEGCTHSRPTYLCWRGFADAAVRAAAPIIAAPSQRAAEQYLELTLRYEARIAELEALLATAERERDLARLEVDSVKRASQSAMDEVRRLVAERDEARGQVTYWINEHEDRAEERDAARLRLSEVEAELATLGTVYGRLEAEAKNWAERVVENNGVPTVLVDYERSMLAAVNAVAEASMELPELTSLRRCCWPGCPRRLDIARVMAGEADPDGWVQGVLSLNYMCREHRNAGHLPRRVERRVRCECGWLSPIDGANLAAILAAWQQHVLGVGG